MRNENELDSRLRCRDLRSARDDRLRTDYRNRPYQGRRLMDDLADSTIGFGLMSLMGMERFDGGKSEEGRECDERREAHQLVHK